MDFWVCFRTVQNKGEGLGLKSLVYVLMCMSTGFNLQHKRDKKRMMRVGNRLCKHLLRVCFDLFETGFCFVYPRIAFKLTVFLPQPHKVNEHCEWHHGQAMPWSFKNPLKKWQHNIAENSVPHVTVVVESWSQGPPTLASWSNHFHPTHSSHGHHIYPVQLLFCQMSLFSLCKSSLACLCPSAAISPPSDLDCGLFFVGSFTFC